MPRRPARRRGTPDRSLEGRELVADAPGDRERAPEIADVLGMDVDARVPTILLIADPNHDDGRQGRASGCASSNQRDLYGPMLPYSFAPLQFLGMNPVPCFEVLVGGGSKADG